MKQKQYGITKERCQEMICGVCSRCGGKLKPLETVDNARNPTFWAGCKKCSRFCWGVDREKWEVARYLIEEGIVAPYSIDKSECKTKEEKENWLNSQTAGTVWIVIAVLNEWKKRKEIQP